MGGAVGLSATTWLITGYWQPLAVILPSLVIYWFVVENEDNSSEFGIRWIESSLAGFPMTHRPGTVWMPILVALITVLLFTTLARWFESLRSVPMLMGLFLLFVGLSAALLGTACKSAAVRKFLFSNAALAGVAGALTWLIAPSVDASVHPVFQTPVSGNSVNRPAVMVTITDDRDLGGWGTAELYLSVQTSRFPSDVHILLPINRGDFRGCRQRFIQLPFEVHDGDNLTFDLIDDAQMTAEQENLVLQACRSAGFCIRIGNAFIKPELDWIVAPTAAAASELIAQSTILTLRDSPFQNFGYGAFIVESSRPATPNEANPVVFLDDSKYSRGQVKVYYPPEPLPAQP